MRLLRCHPYTSIFQTKKYYDTTMLDWHALRLDQFVVEVPLHDLKLPKASLRTKCTRSMLAPSGCTSFDSVNAVVKSSVSVAICFLRRGNKECTLAKLRSLTRWYTGMSQLCYFSNHDNKRGTPSIEVLVLLALHHNGPCWAWCLEYLAPRIPRYLFHWYRVSMRHKKKKNKVHTLDPPPPSDSGTGWEGLQTI